MYLLVCVYSFVCVYVFVFLTLAFPLPGNNEANIIVWMDHRASNEADAINATKHSILATVGGTMSLEMQLPKLLWLKTVSYFKALKGL